ncbi:unnamed protein product, partial [Mesorhabditis spiculigera]
MLKFGFIFLLLISAYPPNVWALVASSRARRFAEDEACEMRALVCYTYAWMTAKGLPHDPPTALEKKCKPCVPAVCATPPSFTPTTVFWSTIFCDPTNYFCTDFPTEGVAVQPTCIKPVAFAVQVAGGVEKKHVLLAFNICTREMLAKETCPLDLLSRVPYNPKSVDISPAFYVQCDAGFLPLFRLRRDVDPANIDYKYPRCIEWKDLKDEQAALVKNDYFLDCATNPLVARYPDDASLRAIPRPCTDVDSETELCIVPPTTLVPATPEVANNTKYWKMYLIAGGAVLMVVIVGGGFTVGFFCKRKRGRAKITDAEDPPVTPSPDGGSEKDSSADVEAASPASTGGTGVEKAKEGVGAGVTDAPKADTGASAPGAGQPAEGQNVPSNASGENQEEAPGAEVVDPKPASASAPNLVRGARPLPREPEERVSRRDIIRRKAARAFSAPQCRVHPLIDYDHRDVVRKWGIAMLQSGPAYAVKQFCKNKR